ncbi:Cys-tRNA(Pro) deacylase [Shewanella waksmanii]|uniref:Cys-tRNA(Pro) deacylase n=1 Tax=Shewanella waksmanii TaxID=213783 RepID=UPI00048C5A66|nr:Cys-tRNA(Pro) deacylase [Shewanella waksmanii]
MTPAINCLTRAKIKFDIHTNQHDEAVKSYGLEAAEKLNLDVNSVFKTLVVQVDNQGLAVAIIPVHLKLNLKALAKVFAAKKVAMAQAQDVLRSTGYVLGGVSPLGQKKKPPTVLDTRAVNQPEIYVSGGKRGLDISLSVKDLIELTRAKTADIAN